MNGILFGLHTFILGLVGSQLCVGISASPRRRSLQVFSCGVFEANRRVYAAFLETFPGWREYVNQTCPVLPTRSPTSTASNLPGTFLRDTHRGRSDDSGEAMQLAAMWNLAVADVLADQRPCHRCNQSYLI
jgi:hypothetical protein